MDYHEWAQRTAPQSDDRDVDPAQRSATGPYAPVGRPGERIDSLDDWSGPITGTGLGGARTDERASADRYWDERYVDNDESGYRLTRHGARTPTQSIPSMRQSPDPQMSRSWREDSLPSSPEPQSSPPVLGSFDDDRDYPIVLTWTAIWYAVPLVAAVLWGVTRSGAPEAICASSKACASDRSASLHAMMHLGPGLVIALALSLGVAVFIRRSSMAWRAITLGFAAAVIGAGVTTLLFTLL